MTLAISFEDVRAAAARLVGVAHRTPVLTSRTADERTGARLHERAHEGPVLVERGAVALHVLLEREGQLVALLERTPEVDEGTETESAQGQMELG